MPTQKPRITFALTQEELEAIEEYRFTNRMKNQSQAILSLIAIGLQSLKTATEDGSPLQSDEARLLDTYRALDDDGKRLGRKLLKTILSEHAQNNRAAVSDEITA